jgi:hypothetical protein
MRAKTYFQSTRLGNVKPGDFVANDDYGRHLKEHGFVEDDPVNAYETKVVKQTPVTPKRKPRKRKVKRDVDDKAND